MKCDIGSEVLSEYVDKRLHPEEQAQIEFHLSECSECREAVQALQEAKRALLCVPRAVPPPIGWQWRLQEAIAEVQRRRKRQRFLNLGLAAAVMLFLVFQAYRVLTAPAPPPPLNVEVLIADFLHAQAWPRVPEKVDPYSLTNWLQHQIRPGPGQSEPPILPPVPIQVGEIRFHHAGLLGAFKCSIPRLVYQTPSGRVNLYWVPGFWNLDHLVPAPASGCSYHPRLYTESGVSLVAWQQGSLVWVLVGRMAPSDLVQLGTRLHQACP